jgi:betaine-aldehyde dehydrogenase
VERPLAADRGKFLLKLADLIESRAEELATLESLDTGHPMRDTTRLDVPRTAMTFRYFGGMADKYEGAVIPVDQGFLNYTLRQPVGVVGQIVPWNFPLMFTSWKMGPALAAGNTVVLKPAALTPLSSLKIAELMQEVGIPKGVVNIIPGAGSAVGQYMAEHTGIAKVSFTGSTEVGKRIVQASVSNLKRIGLELGGKGANVVFADANIPAAVGGSAFAIFHNQGQACIAGSRLILHESIADEFLDRFVKLAQSIKIGNPLEGTTEMGPAHLAWPPRQGARLYRHRARAGRQGADRRRGTEGSSGTLEGLLRAADRGHGQAWRPGVVRRGLRSVRRRLDVQDR